MKPEQFNELLNLAWDDLDTPDRTLASTRMALAVCLREMSMSDISEAICTAYGRGREHEAVARKDAALIDSARREANGAVECQHEGDGLTYVTMPRQFKCKKCRQFVKDRRTGPKDRRKFHHKHSGYGRRNTDNERGGRRRGDDTWGLPQCVRPYGHEGECRADAPKAVELWNVHADGHGRYFVRRGEVCYATCPARDWADEIVNAMNALSGKWPDKLEPLLSACHELIDNATRASAWATTTANLMNALAAFEGETNED